MLSLGQRVHLRMGLAGLVVIALAHDIALVIHDDTANHGVGASIAFCLECQR